MLNGSGLTSALVGCVIVCGCTASPLSDAGSVDSDDASGIVATSLEAGPGGTIADSAAPRAALDASPSAVEAGTLDAAIERDASSAPDGGSDAARDAATIGSDASATVDAATGECSVGGRVCRRYVAQDIAGASLVEMPKYEADYNTGRWQRSITLRDGARSISDPGGADSGVWFVDIPISTSRPSTGVLSLSAERPFGILSAPSALQATWNGRPSGCYRTGNAGEQESVSLSQSTLRDSSGRLLLANGHAPLTSGGSALLVSGDLAEFTLAWVDAGCQVCFSSTTAPPVELRLTVTQDGTSVKILPGERAIFGMGGYEYVFMSQASARPTAEREACGHAFWSVYRRDFWIRLDPTAMRAAQ